MPKTPNHERLLIHVARRAPELVPAAGWLLAWSAPGAQLDLRGAWPSPDELRALADVGGELVAGLMRVVRLEGDLKTWSSGVCSRQHLADGVNLRRAAKARTLENLVDLLRPVDLLTARAAAAARTGVGVETVLESSPAIPLPAIVELGGAELIGSGVGITGSQGQCAAIVVFMPGVAATTAGLRVVSGLTVSLTCIVFREEGGTRRSRLDARVESVNWRSNGVTVLYLREVEPEAGR